MRRDQWLAEFAEKLGVDAPTKEEVVALLDIAAIAAHSSERTAAPIALAGASMTAVDRVEDEERAVRPALHRMLETDVAIVCGGVSVGPHDEFAPRSRTWASTSGSGESR